MNLTATPAFTLTVTLAPPIEAGAVPAGYRRIIPITGGTVDGPDLKGEVLPGGADWNTIRPDGSVHVWARYDFRTADGALVGITNEGSHRPSGEIDPASFAMVTRPVFEASAGAPAWLNTDTFAGILRSGEHGSAVIDIYRLTIS
jgi:hypothetical protein